MTIDLSTTRAGCEVTFRCGGKALVTAVLNVGDWMRFGFGDSPNTDFLITGRYSKQYKHPFDIISITDPPLTEAERLAEIAKTIGKRLKETAKGEVWVSIHIAVAAELLALAEGRAP